MYLVIRSQSNNQTHTSKFFLKNVSDKKCFFYRKVQLENENIINQTVNPTNNEGTKGKPEQQLTSMIYNLWRKTKRGMVFFFKSYYYFILFFNPYFIEKNCDRGNESVLVQIRSPFDRLMTRVTMPNSKSQVQ